MFVLTYGYNRDWMSSNTKTKTTSFDLGFSARANGKQKQPFVELLADHVARARVRGVEAYEREGEER